MATLIYGFLSLNLGESGSLKEIDGDDINQGDLAIGLYGNFVTTYKLNELSGATENIPLIVEPTSNAANKRWELQNIYGNGVYLADTNNSHTLAIKAGSDLSANRILTLTTGDVARTITLSGDPTLADWFDQSVKAASSPQFASIELGDAADTTLSRVSAGVAAIEGKNIYVVGGADVTVADGGTGASTLTDHGILLGSGTDAVTPLGVATNGQLPIGSTGADPVLATLTAGDGIDVTNAAGSISIATDLKANGGIVIETSELAVDLGASSITGTLAVSDGGTGRVTGTTAYALVATGTTATGAQQTLANGATTEVLVGGGASALPVWTTATGSGAPVRATSPTLVTPALGTPASGDLQNCTAATTTTKGVAELATNAEALAGTDTARIITPDDLKYVLDRRIPQYYGVSWDESADTYVRTGSTAGQTCGVTLADAFLPVHRRMRGCLVADDGTVNYYLCATDWTKKEDGVTASDLTGTDGQVMVEIPKFWYRYGHSGTTHTWEVNPVPLTGFKVHEAFMSDDTELDYLYIGAYEACLYDVSASKYVGQCYQTSVSAVFATSDDSITIATRTGWATNLVVGQKLVITGTSNNNGTVTVKAIVSATKITVDENLTDETAATTVIETQTNVTDTTGDKLCSVSGVCPITGGSTNGTRAHFRIWAQNRGGGKVANDAAAAQWSQLYGDANSALQLLYLTEYASFYSQSVLGYGIAALSGATWIAYNDQNPIAKSGNGNAIGNISGCTATSAITTGAGATSVYLKYRGIENLYGHIWKFVDGFKVNNNIPYLCNNFANFSDAESTDNYTNPLDVNGAAITMHNEDGYQGTLELTGRAFMPASLTGGSASAKITDYYYQAAGWRVVLSGGYANAAAQAGAFYLAAHHVLALVNRIFGARLVLRK